MFEVYVILSILFVVIMGYYYWSHEREQDERILELEEEVKRLEREKEERKK